MDKSIKSRGRPSRIRVVQGETGDRRFFTCHRNGEAEEITASVSVVVWQPEVCTVAWNGREYSGGSEVWGGYEGREKSAFLNPVKGGGMASPVDSLTADHAVAIMRSRSEEWMRRWANAIATGGKQGGRNAFRAFREAVERGEVKPATTEARDEDRAKPGITLPRFLHEKLERCPRFGSAQVPGTDPRVRANVERLNLIAERNRPGPDTRDEWNGVAWLLPDAPSWVPRIPPDALVKLIDPMAKEAIENYGVDYVTDPGDEDRADRHFSARQKVVDWLYHGCPRPWEPYGIPSEMEKDLEERIHYGGGYE